MDNDQGDVLLELVLRNFFADYTVIRLSSHRVRSCQKFLTLDHEVSVSVETQFYVKEEALTWKMKRLLQLEDYNSDQGSSTQLSQVTTTTELYTAIPATHIGLSSSDGMSSEAM